MSSLEHQRYALMNGTTRCEQSKCHVGMTQRFTVKEILIADLNVNILIELTEFLYRDVHVLIVPLGIFASVDTHV